MVASRGERGWGNGGGAGVSRCKLLYTEWINKVLLYSMENNIKYPVISHNGKDYEKEYIIYIFY